MKVSLKWLQKYFDAPLPDTAALAEALTFHAFEIEETTEDLLDVKVLPNRAADCLSHRGIARELSAILNLPLASDPLRAPISMYDLGGRTSPLTVSIEDPKKCLRYVGALVRGVKVRPSPDWLREALESVGQHSINNIVDATNYVMLNIGQPLHAFDARALAHIAVRGARAGEKTTILSGEEYALPEGTVLITNGATDEVIGIAGVKGGKAAEIAEATADIIVESANFDGTAIRRTSQALRLATDASQRFQNRPSPELAAYGMRDALALITEISGGEITAVVDEYPAPAPARAPVSVSLEKINSVLGFAFSKEEVGNVFQRLALPYMVVNGALTVTPPFERTDLEIPEDLIEEVGRVMGYDRIPATELPSLEGEPDQARYRGIERIKDELVAQGFTEISTQSFAKKGDIVLANPLDKTKPALRASLAENMQEALAKAKHYAPLVLPPNAKPKLFEIGSIFPKSGETLAIETSEPVPDLPAITDDASYEPKCYELGAFKPFSAYPFIVRDIALWTPAGTEGASVEKVIREHAGDLLVRLDQFDRFEKEGRISYAFRLVFQSDERTLTDEEVNGIMERISAALAVLDYEVR